MPDTKISALPSGAPLVAGAIVPIVQSAAGVLTTEQVAVQLLTQNVVMSGGVNSQVVTGDDGDLVTVV